MKRLLVGCCVVEKGNEPSAKVVRFPHPVTSFRTLTSPPLIFRPTTPYITLAHTILLRESRHEVGPLLPFEYLPREAHGYFVSSHIVDRQTPEILKAKMPFVSRTDPTVLLRSSMVSDEVLLSDCFKNIEGPVTVSHIVQSHCPDILATVSSEHDWQATPSV